MTRHADAASRISPSIAALDEAHARVFLATPMAGVDGELEFARELLEQVLATIDELRRQLREAREPEESTVRHSPEDVPSCPTGDAPAPNQGDAFSDLIPSARPENRPQDVDADDRSGELTVSGTADSQTRDAGADERHERQNPTPTAPARQLVSSTFASASHDSNVHVWTDDDVRYEIEGAERCEAEAAAECADQLRADVLRALATWHRGRARALALLVQASDAKYGWYHAEALIDPIPFRAARFYGGPFDGREHAVIDPPRTIWVAHRADGEALEGAYLIHEVSPAHEFLLLPVPVAPPSGGVPVGWYAWEPRRDRFEWNGLPALA